MPGLLAIAILVPAAFFAGPAVGGGSKVDVCHFPPGDPGNYHTIKISEKAFSAHLAHGDLGGACDAGCATLCDDGDACTIDDLGDCLEVGCPETPEAVDCDDDNECTADSCSASAGCVNAARIGEECDDGQVCSDSDTCDSDGVCQGTAVDDCCIGDGDCSENLCDQATCNLDTNRCDDDPVVCTAPDMCSVSECAPDTGDCVDTATVCPDGESCDMGTGECDADGCTVTGCAVGQTCNATTGLCNTVTSDPCTPYRKAQCIAQGLDECEPGSYACVT